MAVLGGGLGAVSSVGERFCRLGSQPTKNRFGRNSAPPASFSGIFWLIGTALRNLVALTRLGGFTRVFREIRDLLVFAGVSGTWRNFAAAGAQNGPNAQKWIFPVLGAVPGETPADQICSHAKCGPSKPCWGPMCPWGSRYGRSGGAGGHFVGWGLVLSVRDPTDTKFGPEKNRKNSCQC